jgi:hypothetical protein
MQIQSVTNPERTVSSAETRATTKAASTDRTGSARAVDESFPGFSRALDGVPDVRADAVARGRELYQGVPYPPTEIVNGISRLIARFWEA